MNRFAHPVESEELMAWRDGELPAERAADVAAHLEQCSQCRAVVAELRLVSEQMAGWRAEASPPGLGARVMSALEKGEQTRPLVRGWVWKFAAVMGMLLLIFSISVPNLLRSRSAADEAMRPAKQRERPFMTTAPGQPGVAGGAEVAEAPTGPMVVRTASLTLTTQEFDSVRAAMERIVRQHRGYLGQLSVSGQAGAARVLTATLRLPAASLDAALADLKKLGTLETESQSGEEVTQQYVDLVARLSNARNTEQRLIEVLRQRTGKVADVLPVEQEIARVRGEIERMEAQRKNLEKQVGFAAVRFCLREAHKAQFQAAPRSTPRQLWNALVEGYKSLLESALGLAIFLLRYGPTLLFWFAVLFWPARFLWRQLRRVQGI